MTSESSRGERGIRGYGRHAVPPDRALFRAASVDVVRCRIACAAVLTALARGALRHRRDRPARPRAAPARPRPHLPGPGATVTNLAATLVPPAISAPAWWRVTVAILFTADGAALLRPSSRGMTADAGHVPR
ncbi:hypothetical protein J2S43_005244 [Catenuloplanes nepalensis]|uniref:Uncharacterized protein n=1 Tax=Catenuloplanes nepalensis TaxID=587533 RepID=A0ABT9MZ57_9ACTN|nr:hypothetical protein [Catenuloplanes nepalensis]MDP9796732.1 hypothetical protein [Catenuloplanes nepalensis]